MTTTIETSLKPFVRRAALDNSRWFGANLFSFLATGADTGGQFAIVEMLLVPGGEPPLHTHAVDDEAFYVLEGSVVYRIGDETTIARAGEFVVLPSGIEHGFRVIGGKARVLLISAPSGLEEAFHALSVPAEAMTPRHNPPPFDIPEFMTTFGKQGLAFRSPESTLPVATPNPALTIRPAIGRSYWYFGNLFTPLVTGEQTGGKFSIIEAFGRRNPGPPPHIHNREEEAFYILEGKATVHCGGERYELTAGDFIFLPRGIAHRPEITSDTARVLLFALPAGFEKYFEEHSEPATALVLPPAPPADAYDPEVMIRAAKKYGFDLVAPAS